jgi:hypothetical protein
VGTKSLAVGFIAISPRSATAAVVRDRWVVGAGQGGRSRSTARGWLARIGLSLAFAGLVLFTLAAVLGFGDAHAGETLHPVSVPLTGIGMLLTGVATIRTRHWNGWRRLAPLLCGIVPFAVELPGFIAFGDSTALHYFIACTWTAWLILFTAPWPQSRTPAAGLTTLPMAATAASQARN